MGEKLQPKIVVIDDSESIRETLMLYLDSCGFMNYEIYESAEDFRNYCAVRKVDFLITDYVLPGENGYDLARVIKKRGHTFPILLLTLEHDISIFSDYVDFVASKPLSLDELDRIFAEALANWNDSHGENNEPAFH